MYRDSYRDVLIGISNKQGFEELYTQQLKEGSLIEYIVNSNLNPTNIYFIYLKKGISLECRNLKV